MHPLCPLRKDLPRSGRRQRARTWSIAVSIPMLHRAWAIRSSEANCESCGLCISTCPTGAITENKLFKPGPVATESFNTICNYCSVGCTLEVHHRKGFVMEVRGAGRTDQ